MPTPSCRRRRRSGPESNGGFQARRVLDVDPWFAAPWSVSAAVFLLAARSSIRRWAHFFPIRGCLRPVRLRLGWPVERHCLDCLLQCVVNERADYPALDDFRLFGLHLRLPQENSLLSDRFVIIPE